jgi:hypothetical protein
MSLKRVNYKGYETASDSFGISAAIVVPANSKLIATSGQVGVEVFGDEPGPIAEQLTHAFAVSNAL